MQVTVSLNDNLLKEAAELTGINETEALVNQAVSELVKLQLRRELLKYEGSGVWEDPRYVRRKVAK